MQMFLNSVQSESILILGKFSPAERGGREQRGNLGDGERLKVKGEMGERGKGEMGKRLKVKGDMRERGKGKKGKGGNVD